MQTLYIKKKCFFIILLANTVAVPTPTTTSQPEVAVSTPTTTSQLEQGTHAAPNNRIDRERRLRAKFTGKQLDAALAIQNAALQRIKIAQNTTNAQADVKTEDQDSVEVLRQPKARPLHPSQKTRKPVTLSKAADALPENFQAETGTNSNGQTLAIPNPQSVNTKSFLKKHSGTQKVITTSAPKELTPTPSTQTPKPWKRTTQTTPTQSQPTIQPSKQKLPAENSKKAEAERLRRLEANWNTSWHKPQQPATTGSSQQSTTTTPANTGSMRNARIARNHHRTK